MSKHRNKRKNKERTEQEQLCIRLGTTTKDPLMSVGIVTDHLFISQNTVPMLGTVNQLCHSNVGVDISIFVMHWFRSFMIPLCPIFNIHRLASWEYPLITTSVASTREAMSTKTKTIIHYVWTPDFINAYRNDKSTFTDPRITVVARHKDYKDLLMTEFGLTIDTPIVPDFDATTLVRLAIAKNNQNNHGENYE